MEDAKGHTVMDALHALSEALPHNVSLQTLSLKGNSLTTAALQNLIPGVVQNFGLKVIPLSRVFESFREFNAVFSQSVFFFLKNFCANLRDSSADLHD
jgi:Tfp pilus assembly protein PilN